MASLVTDSRLWTYLRGFVTRINSLVRSVVIFRQQDPAINLEQGLAANQDIGAILLYRRHHTGCSDRWLDALSHSHKAKLRAMLRSLLRMGRQNAPEADIESVHSTTPEGISDLEYNLYLLTFLQDRSMAITIKNNAIAISQEDHLSSQSQSHSISSILDLMPIPVTTSKERAIATSILVALKASPVRYATPPLMSPSTISSPGTPYFINSPASTTLNTPPSMYAPLLRSPTSNVYSTPFLDQCTRLDGPPPCDMSVSLSITSVFETSEIHGQQQQIPRQTRPKTWTGHAGFAFPINDQGLFCVAEEEDSISSMEPDDTLVTSVGDVHAISDSPWDNGEQENYGLKGKASWTREMKSLDSFSDNQLWIDVPMEDWLVPLPLMRLTTDNDAIDTFNYYFWVY